MRHVTFETTAMPARTNTEADVTPEMMERALLVENLLLYNEDTMQRLHYVYQTSLTITMMTIQHVLVHLLL